MSARQRRDLRQAIVALLSNQGRQPYPTIAKGMVFDTKSDEIQFHAADRQCPFILVTIDRAGGVPQTSMNAWDGVTHSVEVILELGLTSDAASRQTDAQLEAALDEFEGSVLELLLDRANNPGAQALGKMYSKLLGVRSERMGHARSEHRLAMRSVSIDLELNPRCKSYEDAFPELQRIGMVVAASALDWLLDSRFSAGPAQQGGC
ncbi:hypothetical protein ROS1_28650 [Roseibium sp. ROS1]